ncbi:selenium metabolism-associated LysR family transcriptional regulator [Solidesulfovibrio sp.]|uniref:selenium metabolism-associated LysR family transcriptional regulator n=1 Tax=Solidesulfovibrio sp. TaxID=2910990 RepID=UPI000ED95A4A|nr:selenium metabolism-associated LysR family transcriptional regulator [Solidesulfovibrio sp.]MEA5090343.1 selenium metabolism-associated LysR family transcriptional regulator [Solidesulfovibrio sp.]HCR11877.1 LysR family transcriptional regulator [Desulfovibrio sp.]HML60410.1 selenium metabolism-associated LysR family transcriptional regulator [Solidesulfovibrio sp.]
MDIRRLQAFAKVYDLRSFSKAGEEMLLSQPTISAHVMALEEELGTQLFDRLGRTILPTQAGNVLYRYCTAIFSQLDHARADILALSKRVAGELIIGGSTIPAQYIIPRLVARFVGNYPEVRVEVRGGDTSEIIAMVAEGTVHVGIVGAPASQAELVSRPILQDELVLIAPAALAASGAATADLKARLLGVPWVMREPGSGTQAALEQALARVDIDVRDLRVMLQVHSSVAILECVEAGLGVAAISRMAAANYLERGGVAILPTEGLAMRRDFYVVQHGRRYMFPAQRLFLRACGNGQ